MGIFTKQERAAVPRSARQYRHKSTGAVVVALQLNSTSDTDEAYRWLFRNGRKVGIQNNGWIFRFQGSASGAYYKAYVASECGTYAGDWIVRSHTGAFRCSTDANFRKSYQVAR